MPLIVRSLGVVKAGPVNNKLVSNLDFAETCPDMAGLADQTPGDMQKRSLVPLLTGKSHGNWRNEWEFFSSEAALPRLESGDALSPTLAVFRQPC